METPESVAATYHLSQRAAENVVHGDHWAPIEMALENAWDKENNPSGMYEFRDQMQPTSS